MNGFSLDDFVSVTAKVRLVRLVTRGGLVRTRMAGIRAARGEVLTFLDSHIEATHGWLEPLLDRSVIISSTQNLLIP